MARLIFKNRPLLSILKYTLEAKSFRVSFCDAIAKWEKETKKEYDFKVKIDPKFYESDKPTLFIVHDSGLYIMTGAKLDAMPKDHSHVAYAVGYNPHEGDVYDKCGQAVGYDDFAESFEFTEELQTAVKNGADIIIDITPTRLAVSYRIKPMKTANGLKLNSAQVN